MLPSSHDLSRLTRPAEEANAALGPVLLRVQADLFAGAPVRDARTVAAFEALALAILPRSDNETLIYVNRRVAHLRETPDSVRRLLASSSIDDADLAHGRELQALVDRAREDVGLARTLLMRDDLPATEAARLYLHADEAGRASIRAALAGSGEANPARLTRPTRDTLNGLVEAAAARDGALFGSRLCRALGVPDASAAWRFGVRSRRDLLALALVAIGAPEEICVRIFLTLEPDIARSVTTVFALVEIVRRTPRSVAVRVVEAALDLKIEIPRRAPRNADEQRREERARLAGRPASLTPRQALTAAADIRKRAAT